MSSQQPHFLLNLSIESGQFRSFEMESWTRTERFVNPIKGFSSMSEFSQNFEFLWPEMYLIYKRLIKQKAKPRCTSPWNNHQQRALFIICWLARSVLCSFLLKNILMLSIQNVVSNVWVTYLLMESIWLVDCKLSVQTTQHLKWGGKNSQ